MHKALKNKNLHERPASRGFLALALATSLAAFGCTTNRTPGNGDPVGVHPGAGPAPPTSGVTGTSSGTTPSNPPMFSSSTYVEALPSVNARLQRLPLSAAEAAAVMADNQFGRGVRVLGPVNPGATTQDASTGPTVAASGFQNPAMRTNPILTVNSSISSAGQLPAIISGAGGSDAGVVTSGTTSAVTSNAVVGGTSVTTTGAAVTNGTTVTNAGTATTATTSGAVFSPATSAVTPTTAAPAFSTGSFAAGPGTAAGVVPGAAVSTNSTGTLTPTVASSANVTPTVSTSPVATTVSPTTRAATANATRSGTLLTTRNTTTTRAATTTTTASGSATATVAPITVRTDANGKVTISNAKQNK